MKCASKSARQRAASTAAFGLSAALLACTPALDWRTTPVEGSTLTALFPCKPDQFSRRVSLANQSQVVALTSCQAAAQTFAVASVDMQQPERADAGLAWLKQSAEQNFGGLVRSLPPLAVLGADHAGRGELVVAELQRPDGSRVQAQLLFFSQGAWVYQATVMGESPDAEAVVFFFENLKLSR